MKYKIINSDLFINNKLHPEGSEVELTKEQTKGIESFLFPIESDSKSHSVHREGSEIKVTQTKIKGNKK